jgi:transcription elongation factor GreA
MTAAGYSALQDELKYCQQGGRQRITEQINFFENALFENLEYYAAKKQQLSNENRIAELKDILARAELINISKLSGDTIKFGAILG